MPNLNPRIWLRDAVRWLRDAVRAAPTWKKRLVKRFWNWLNAPSLREVVEQQGRESASFKKDSI
ncbi:hypothetical protein, partial [Ventosimonas gracilis]|uniref:hypothetical protein n=1 Tax=Ventosimonas gracilis TaxID=1680762 RepID=UPI00128FC268